MKKKTLFTLLLLVIALAGFWPTGSSSAASPVFKPLSITTTRGAARGNVTALGVRDQSRRTDRPSKYVLFSTPGKVYKGYRTFQAPATPSGMKLLGFKVQVNYKGPARTSQAWNWSLYDWNSSRWVKIGDNALAPENSWKMLTFTVNAAARFASPTGEIRLLLQSNNASGNAKLDYEAISITYAPGDPPFPRLGMWWPNPWKQSLDDIARYDWVILDNEAREFIEPLTQRNPRIRLLNSTNACELGFDPQDPPSNTYLRKIPYQWFLTQVGTTIRANITATQTTIPVERVALQGGGKTIELFIPGDAILIEGESMQVRAVNKANRSLTVQRGYIRPASAHKAGTRIAAHISFWPNSWVMNVSTLSPTGIHDSAIGPERWTDYLARDSASLLKDRRWAGLLVDRSDGNESWLIGNSTARSIDPDQSNHLPASYAAFDNAWNLGLKNFETRLRKMIGPDRIIFTNWGYPNFEMLNGNNFEGFPDNNGQYVDTPWSTIVFGPWLKKGSYFEWLQKSRQPNLTMLETYEDDSGTDPTGDGSYYNRCNDAGFIPNYRKMRYGLATALLNDGYFSYEMNTNGHGSLCLMWFDEYDNAGAGRGYLGFPLAPAFKLFSNPPSPDLAAGGQFDSPSDLSLWDARAETGYAINASLDTSTFKQGTASVRLDITQAAGTDWKASFSYEPVSVVQDKEYTLTFWAKANKTHAMTMWAQQNQPPWSVRLWYD
ncbi:MAG: hypothetical protein EHM81_02900, partial [Chloroflexi bacterium]